MKEIDLSPYDIGEQKDAFDPRKFLGETLLSPILKLGGMKLLQAFNFANKIQQHKGNSLLVDETEYKQLLGVANLPEMAGALMGFSAVEVEMIRRILEAKDVEVEKKE